MVRNICSLGVCVFGWAVFLLYNASVTAFHTGALVYKTGGICHDMATINSYSRIKSLSVKSAQTPRLAKLIQRQSHIAPKMSSGDNIAAVVGSYKVKILRSIDEISEDEWNACALDAAGEGKENPFVLWAFFKALEDSQSAVGKVGWAPSHLSVR
jgi:hypothetical protein